MPKDINEYRVVCPRGYPPGTAPSAMSGHYPYAKTAKEAVRQVEEKFPLSGLKRVWLWKSWDADGNRVPVPLPKDYK